jgi:hypothetical protein
VDGQVVETALEATYLGGYSDPPSSRDTLS